MHTCTLAVYIMVLALTTTGVWSLSQSLTWDFLKITALTTDSGCFCSGLSIQDICKDYLIQEMLNNF